MHRTKVRVVEDALDANNTIASANRGDFDRAGVTVVNLMSAPGAGKTTLLERALDGIAEEGLRVGVLEGDAQGSFDADRLSALDIPVVQLNTDNGFGGECHLDANMVRSALPAVALDDMDVLIVENVGNLVCPAEFRIGEDARIMVCSVTEGEDKPLKYPLMFRACELVIINKIDLLEHLDFDVDRLEANLDAVHPGADRIARLCHRMAERFAANGRLVALAATPAARSDARHVAVEFVHPVIVGKRALPALALAGEGGDPAAQVDVVCEPGDIAVAFGEGVEAATALARERG